MHRVERIFLRTGMWKENSRGENKDKQHREQLGYGKLACRSGSGNRGIAPRRERHDVLYPRVPSVQNASTPRKRMLLFFSMSWEEKTSSPCRKGLLHDHSISGALLTACKGRRWLLFSFSISRLLTTKNPAPSGYNAVRTTLFQYNLILIFREIYNRSHGPYLSVLRTSL